MTASSILSGVAGELALFAAAGYLLFAVDDLLVDLIYFTRRLWRAATVYSRGHFPSILDDAVRQKARWLGGIAFAGWDRLGWRGGIGERWMRMRDRRGPLAALLMTAGYLAAFMWSQIWLATLLGAPRPAPPSPALFTLLTINGALLCWRVLMRIGFTASAYGWRQGLLSIPRLMVGNLIALLAARRAFLVHATGGPRKWDKTRHIFPTELPRG